MFVMPVEMELLRRGAPRSFVLVYKYCASVLAGGFHSATFATFDRSLRFRSTQALPRSIRRCVEPPAPPSAPCYGVTETAPWGALCIVRSSIAGCGFPERQAKRHE
jgi:hypothetical protein